MSPRPETTPDVQRFLQRVPAELQSHVEELRALVRAVATETTETVLWNTLSYHKAHEGGRVKGAVCQIGHQEGCVSVGFIHGVSLADPGGFLRGTAKAKRYVRIPASQPIPREALRKLILAAVAHHPGSTA